MALKAFFILYGLRRPISSETDRRRFFVLGDHMKTIRLGIAQINCTVGDLEGNCRKITDCIKKGNSFGLDILSFPELSVTGYPPEDLIFKRKFIEDNLDSLKEITAHVKDMVVIVGYINRIGSNLYNAAAVINNKAIKGTYHKMILPNYGVFDEKRYFTAGDKPLVFGYGDIKFAVNICEDIWHDNGPAAKQASAGADVIININSSPYHMGKMNQRDEIIRTRAKDNNVIISYTNLVGGQDELVFDGHSMVVDSKGKIITRAESFREDLLALEIQYAGKSRKLDKGAIIIKGAKQKKVKSGLPIKNNDKSLNETEEVYEALKLGLRDYVKKNNFEKVVIGLSGGIDSSLVAALAFDALGKENVTGVFMPTRYSSEQSEKDAKSLAGNLGIRFMSIPIEQIFKLYLLALEPKFSGQARDLSEENLQARIRGNMLMALSNKFGWMVLTTGNKSEMSTGYATLYGDMAGGFAVIKDVYKTLVYKLSRYRNSLDKIIPDSVLTKEPTAELKPNQKDSDTLPPYNMLDPVLKAYIEEDRSMDEIMDMGFDGKVVQKILGMVDRSEYKRRQSPPGIKITPKAFGKDRRMPITNKYR